jgi:23S rRNA (guanosine2251-2'-O)-methyltransferase
MQTIYGINPVSELLKCSPEKIKRIIIPDEKLSERVCRLIESAKSAGRKIDIMDPREFQRISGHENVQKILAEVRNFEYADIDSVVDLMLDSGSRRIPVLVAADCITDPHNIGAVIRSIWFFGGAGLILTEDRSAHVNDTVIKASAGAAFLLPVVKVTNLARTLNCLKEQGISIAGSTADENGKSIFGIEKLTPHVIVAGSEGRGMRRLVREQCDYFIKIPSATGFESLNVSVFMGIYMFMCSQKQHFSK